MNVRIFFVPLAALCLTACGGEPDVLVASFADELVEAPARTVEVIAVSDTECAALLAVTHSDVPTIGNVLIRRTVRYPVNPEDGVLDDLPKDRPIALDVAAFDASNLQIARGCQVVTLASGGPTTVEIMLHALPVCAEAPTMLDLTMVLDTSLEMRNANIALENQLIDRLQVFAGYEGYPAGSKLGIVVHGHTASPTEVQAPSSNRTEVAASLEALRDVSGGFAAHAEAITFAAGLLRARAVCGRRPLILVVGGGADAADGAQLEIARISLYATRGDPSDDLYVYGIGLSQDALDAFDILIPAEVGEVEGALTAPRFAEALSNARFRFQALVGGS